ncbi:uncharacterized protein LOC131637657 [Vicia villosa]|uniref:uncharacterized protein LOC131637657 n=1 Tax=Vicia villosa TaxID=3911 RepID=UPI00273AF2FE|nr:uncharacterized protein LOC131637657 [Vicia villosa]
MEHCNAVIAHAKPRLQLSKNEEEQDVDPTQYRRLIRLLRYLCNTRPNLALSISIASKFIERPKEMCSNEGGAVMVLVDNIFAISLAKNSIAHGRSKHIEMRFHYLKELVSEVKLRLRYCRSEDQVGDLLIKGVTNDVFKRLKMSMSMKDLEHLN